MTESDGTIGCAQIRSGDSETTLPLRDKWQGFLATLHAWRAPVMSAALLMIVASFGLWLTKRSAHVHVNDSRIAAHIVALSSEVAGRVTAMHVLAGDRVARNDLLLTIEAAQPRLELQEIDAQRTGIDAQQNQLRAQQQMVLRQTASRLKAAQYQLIAADANRRALAAEAQGAASQYERLQALHKAGAVAEQYLEASRAQFVSAQQQELQAAAAIESARANLAVIDAENEQVVVIEKQIAALEAQKAALAAHRRRQLVDLEKRELRAAFDGVIDQTFVDTGEYVSPGTRLLMYHDPKDVWVDALVKETDFGRLRLGASARITVDAFSDRDFSGEVVRLGHATTSQFALLPNPNPSGSFTKVTQRLPVRIALEQHDDVLRPGMMVEVSIDVLD